MTYPPTLTSQRESHCILTLYILTPGRVTLYIFILDTHTPESPDVTCPPTLTSQRPGKVSLPSARFCRITRPFELYIHTCTALRVCVCAFAFPLYHVLLSVPLTQHDSFQSARTRLVVPSPGSHPPDWNVNRPWPFVFAIAYAMAYLSFTPYYL